jgi:hypothetical protein
MEGTNVMNTKYKTLSRFALLAMCASASCVSARSARNGVFNENQYVRKDFLVRSGSSSMSADPGWYMQTTIVQSSTPNVLGNVNGAGLFMGAQSGSYLVRWAVTQDKLQLIDMREPSSNMTIDTQNQRTPNVINVWPITNVDLKYRINLDGETTNFYEENQENDWQQRQWVKLNFAKNDLSDLAPFNAGYNMVLAKCTSEADTSATLIPNSLVTDTDNGYMEFGVQLVIPIQTTGNDADNATCVQAFGPAWTEAAQLGRGTVTINLLYSFVRTDKIPQVDGTYVPLALAEKDPIRHKYGAFELGTGGPAQIYRDPNTGLLGANQLVMRFDPNKTITYYFAPGVPDEYKTFFTQTVVPSTNAVLSASGSKATLQFLNFDDDKAYMDGGNAKTPKHFGDIRYSWLVFHSDLDNRAGGLLGIAQFAADLRTGQTISASVNVWDSLLKDTAVNRLDFFLQTVGAEFLTANGEFDDSKYPSSCAEGQTMPLVNKDIAAELNLGSTVYNKMQAFLQKPVTQFGNLGPVNFLPTHDADFYNAYYALLPYNVYADPKANMFVNPEGSVFQNSMQENWQGLEKLAQFDQFAANIDHGIMPYDVNASDSVQQAIAYNHQLRDLTQAVQDYEHIKARNPLASKSDDLGLFSYVDIYQKNGRRCTGGKWESRADYTKRLVTNLNSMLALHEFGHTLGLRHNFMGSVDGRNYPQDMSGNTLMYAASIMDYNQTLVEGVYNGGWPNYDASALGWIYSNNLDMATAVPALHAPGTGPGISQQSSPTSPWNDKLGFCSAAAPGTNINPATNQHCMVNGMVDATREIPYLYCSDEHIAYTPLCRHYDMGTTPSEIMANEIQQREWNYQWTNFRLYHKYFDLTNYGQSVATSFTEYRRFLSLWDFDWSPGEITNTLRLIGIQAPPGTTAADYYAQLTNKFNQDASVANQISAAYHRAIIDQSSGERPFITVFDPFFGDTTQQGIQIDKEIAISSFSTLWPAISNYDPSQAGAFVKTNAVGQDIAYNNLAQGVLEDFLGAAFATYTYAQIGPIAAFAEETHSSMWPGPRMMRDWVGGLTFDRERDFLDYVRGIAAKFHFANCDENGLNCHPCTTFDNCSWDPRTYQTRPSQITQSDSFNRFQAPDGRTYIWEYISTRNQWILADKDRNVAMYTLMLTWSTDVVNSEDDGYAGATELELKVRFAMDAFNYFDDDQTSSKN